MILVHPVPERAHHGRRAAGASKDVFKFRPVCQSTPDTPRAQRNPATTFRVVEHGFCSLTSYSTGPAQNRQLCIEMLRDSRSTRENYLRDNNPFYVGTPSIMYLVNDVSIMQFTLFPVCRSPHTVNIKPPMKAVLSELVRYCVYTMGTAFPLRAAGECLPYYAVPGRFSHEKGRRWAWAALFHDMRRLRRGARGLSSRDGGASPGTPVVLMDLYSALWAMKTSTIGARSVMNSVSEPITDLVNGPLPERLGLRLVCTM